MLRQRNPCFSGDSFGAKWKSGLLRRRQFDGPTGGASVRGHPVRTAVSLPADPIVAGHGQPPGDPPRTPSGGPQLAWRHRHLATRAQASLFAHILPTGLCLLHHPRLKKFTTESQRTQRKKSMNQDRDALTEAAIGADIEVHRERHGGRIRIESQRRKRLDFLLYHS